MTITQKLRNAFPGISVIITGIARSFNAFMVYKRGVEAVKTFCSEVPSNKWMLIISMHPPFSYYDAYRIVTFLQKDSKRLRNGKK